MKRKLLTALIGVVGFAAPVAAATVPAYSTTGPAATAVTSTTNNAPDIPAANIMAHMNAFQQIANNNGGNRAHGRPGYAASVDYVKAKLDAAGYITTRQAFTYNGATSWNVIAEWPYGDANQVVMAGAHLDSVTAGPGINDNASGSAAVLEVALEVARSNLRPAKRLRFGWWGTEELGLIGSKYYTDNLGSTARARIQTYLNFDMVGQKSTTVWGVYVDSSRLKSMFVEYFSGKGIGTRDVNIGGRSDHASFSRYGIEVSGISSGSDPCYHAACDTITNVADRVMYHSTNAAAHVLWKLANATASGCAGYEQTFTGSLASGGSAYHPNGSYFHTGASGTHRACLDGPAGTDFDMYLQKWVNGAWSTVAQGTSPGPDESLSYSGTSGYYRYRVHAYSGSGSYTLGYDVP